MKSDATLIGLVVLAVVGVGVFWVRFNSPPPSIAQLASDSDRRGFSIVATLPDVTLAEGTVDLEDVRITLSLTPRPPVALVKMRVRVRAEANGAPVRLEAGRVSFEMTMPMGDHRYSLVPGSDGWQEAEVVLPLCPSGKQSWYATVEGAVAGRPRTARFRLDLAPTK